MDQNDFYEILGVDSQSDSNRIKEAYRRLAFEYHPDKNKGNSVAADRMKSINEAYAVLSDVDKRREYDALRRQFGSSAYRQFRQSYSEKDIFNGSDINSIFEEMARAFGFRGFEEVFKEVHGQGYRTFEFKNPGIFAKGFVFTGPFGRGGRIRQQQYISPKSQRVLGKLSRYAFKKISGMELPEHGEDYHDVIQLTAVQAAQGGPYAYLHRKNSKKIIVRIPPNIKEGQRIRLAGMGREGKGSGTPGDLYLKVKIKKPLLRKIKDFIADFQKT